MGTLWDNKEHHLRHGHHIFQCLLDYTMGEYVHEVKDIYNIPSIDRWEDKSSHHNFGASFEELQSEASKDM